MTDQRRIWEKIYNQRPRQEPATSFARRCARSLTGARPHRILELGCGSGADSRYFARRGHHVTALDFSSAAVRLARRHAVAKQLSALQVVQADHAHLPLPFQDATFDLVYSHLTLHYFTDTLTRAIAADIWRVLRPGGLCWVKCKSTDDPLYGQGTALGEHTFACNGHRRHFFSRDYMAVVLAPFTLLTLRRTAASRDGQRSAFIEATARRPLRSSAR